MDGFSVETTPREGCVVLSVRGEVDLATAPQLRDALAEVVADGHRCVVVDLGETEFLDSTGLGALVTALKRLRSKDGELRVVVKTSRIRKVFEITSLHLVIPMYDTVEEACGGR